MNHTSKAKYRYFEICPRGFSNETTVYRVPLEKVAEVNSRYDGEIDRQFDRGNTNYNCRWIEPSKRSIAISIDWSLDTFSAA